MIRVVGTRGSGKTEALIRESSEKNMPILSYTQAEANYIREAAERMQVVIPKPVVYGEKLRGINFANGVLIDNLEFFTSRLLKNEGIKVAGFSVSSEE